MEQTPCCSEPSLDSDIYLSLPEDVSAKWKGAERRYHRERGPAAGTILPEWRSQSDIYVEVRELARSRTGRTDNNKICVSRNDRQAAYLYQTRSHCWRDTKSLDRPGWPAPFVTHSQRLEETDRYTWISATRSCSLTHKLYCPSHLRHPVPRQLFIFRSTSAPLGQCSGVHNQKAHKLNVSVWISSPRL